MEPIVGDGQADRIRLRAKMTPIPPYKDEVKDALTYELTLARLGKSSWPGQQDSEGAITEVPTHSRIGQF